MARANSMVLNKLACVLLMSMVLGAPPAHAAITCGQVSSSLQACIPYLTTGGVVPPACCGGVKSLKSAATTPIDRQQACNCLKTASTAIRGIDYNRAAGLPGLCGVNIPYKISPTTDCTRVN